MFPLVLAACATPESTQPVEVTDDHEFQKLFDLFVSQRDGEPHGSCFDSSVPCASKGTLFFLKSPETLNNAEGIFWNGSISSKGIRTGFHVSAYIGGQTCELEVYRTGGNSTPLRFGENTCSEEPSQALDYLMDGLNTFLR